MDSRNVNAVTGLLPKSMKLQWLAYVGIIACTLSPTIAFAQFGQQQCTNTYSCAVAYNNAATDAQNKYFGLFTNLSLPNNLNNGSFSQNSYFTFNSNPVTINSNAVNTSVNSGNTVNVMGFQFQPSINTVNPFGSGTNANTGYGINW